MKAMIFAAGLGTRLKPLTDSMPKALVPINGKPLLEHVLLKLKQEGFTDIIINVHHFADQIVQFLAQNQHFGLNIAISDETQQLLETGGGIKKASWFFGNEPFLIHNVDILSNLPLAELVRFHSSKPNAAATLVVSKRTTTRYLLFDNDMQMKGWTNIQTNEIKSSYPQTITQACSEFAFSGIHVFSPALFPYFEAYPAKFSVIDFYIDVCGKAAVYGYVPTNLQLLDVGKIDSIQQAELFVQTMY
ncbi:MAG TPA: nucleotidyltransferase family protein [Paludibacteraceae bacterium]|nr:nucleotidyltransferase family protein [Paludibacteraceae bacterium]